MTNEDFDRAYADAKDGDFFSIEVAADKTTPKDLIGVLIENFAGDKAHIGLLFKKADNKTIEAWPPKIGFADILNYRGREGVSIFFYRLYNQTDIQTQQILSEAVTWLGEPYNLKIIAQQLWRKTICGLPVIGFLFNKFLPKLPMWFAGDPRKDGMDCSGVSTLIIRKACPGFLKDIPDARAVTPDQFSNAPEILDVSRACA
jgi:hypothetical protein